MSNAGEWLKRYGLAPKKSWGQNFLVDPGAIERLAYACELNEADTCVVEIGAGTGALTERLIAPGRMVLAIERDRDLAVILRERFGEREGIRILEANALGFDYAHAAKEAGGKLKVIGNLPYHLTAPVLFQLMRARRHLTSAHLLVQREVAVRIVAAPGSDDYSLLSVLLGRVAHAEPGVPIGRGAFLPPPKVESRSVILRFDREVAESPGDALFIAFAKAAFHKRRKRLINSLDQQPFLALSKETRERLRAEYPEWLAVRAEELPISAFVTMAARLEEWGVVAPAQAANEDGIEESEAQTQAE